MSRPRLKTGDVFAVPIDESRVGVGQVVAGYGEHAFYFAIFDVVAPDAEGLDLDAAVSGRLLFLALSMDAKLFAGHWRVVGHRAVSEQMPLPAFKVAVGAAEDIYVEDFSGQKRRPATDSEVERLPYRKVVAPVRLEMALRAKHGLQPWVEAYTDLAPDETMTSARLFD